MSVARGLGKSVALAAAQHVLNGRLQVCAMADGNKDRAHVVPGTKHGADDVFAVVQVYI